MTTRKAARKMMPRPNVPLLMDPKLVGMLKAMDKIKQQLEDQKTAMGKKRWSLVQYHTVLEFVEGEAKTKIADRLIELFGAQYPKNLYVR